MRKKVAIAVVALLTGALMLPGHEASARGGGWFGGGHSGFGGYGYDRGYGYGRAFGYGRGYGHGRGYGYYGSYGGYICDRHSYLGCYN
jgi:hypothetical protein